MQKSLIEKMRRTMIMCLCLFLTTECFSRIIPFTDAEELACQEHVNEMKYYCRIAVLDNFALLKHTYVVPREVNDIVFLLCTEREVRKAAHNYIEHDDMVRIERKQQIDSIYQDCIDTCLMRYNPKIAGSMMLCTLNLLSVLGVEKEKIHSLVTLGLDVSRRLRKDPCYNYDIDVMKSLKKLLSRKQLSDIIDSKNAQTAVARSRNVWRQLKESGLVAPEDSTKEFSKMINYCLAEMRINDLYVDNEDMRMNNMRDLWRRQPLAVRIYESVNRKKEIKKVKGTSKEEELIW